VIRFVKRALWQQF